MTGTTGNIIPIVIVPVLALAFWLVMMYYTASHPRWGSQVPTDTLPTPALQRSVPAQRPSPGPVVPGRHTAADEGTPVHARASQTGR